MWRKLYVELCLELFEHVVRYNLLDRVLKVLLADVFMQHLQSHFGAASVDCVDVVHKLVEIVS